MCGIVGVFSKNKIKLSSIQSMNDSIVHRGPDDEGYLSGGDNINDTVLNKLVTIDTDVNMVFGHRRLAIQDLSEYGHQPMLYLERYWIVYNGEIYNFHELKKSLEVDGYFFVSNSDTEVIMAAYDKWGASCLERFNGMWAFVIYDSHKKKVFISRDRFGIKPLYYYQDENNFVFASEIKALLHYPNVSCEPDLGYCKLFLKEGPKEYIKNTAFKNIFRFKKASFLECDLNTIFSNFKENRFWEVSVNLSSEKFDSGKAKKYAEKYYGLLKSSVELRLRADVKVGSALSGGLDSSSIVYLINQQLSEVGDGDKQETFSSVYLDENTEHCDESFFIDEITNNLDVSSNRIEPNIDEIIDCHKKYIYHLDTPAANTLMSNWYTYKLTNQKNIKISLDGQGADEQIAGYFRYLTHIVFESSILSIIKLVYSSRKINGAKSYIFRGLMLKILN